MWTSNAVLKASTEGVERTNITSKSTTRMMKKLSTLNLLMMN
jgi:hypothetical protein